MLLQNFYGIHVLKFNLFKEFMFLPSQRLFLGVFLLFLGVTRETSKIKNKKN